MGIASDALYGFRTVLTRAIFAFTPPRLAGDGR
jgi:hypothetical protein